MDNASVIAFATALEMELEPLRKELESIAREDDSTALQERLESFDENLPELLATVIAGSFAAHHLESIMATHYAEGVGSAGIGVVRTVGTLMRSDRAYAAVEESHVLYGAPNTLIEAKHAILVRSQAVSKVVKGQIVQDLRTAILNTEGTIEFVQSTVKELAESLSDLSGNEHVISHTSANVEQSKGYGEFSAKQTSKWLTAHSYQELYRLEEREEWRDWPQRWDEQGGEFNPHGPSDYDAGRMIALSNSSIWSDLANPENYSDGTGNEYSPLAFNSGMALRSIPNGDLAKLGLKPVSQTAKRVGFNASVGFQVTIDGDLRDALLGAMSGWEEHKGELQEKSA